MKTGVCLDVFTGVSCRSILLGNDMTISPPTVYSGGTVDTRMLPDKKKKKRHILGFFKLMYLG